MRRSHPDRARRRRAAAGLALLACRRAPVLRSRLARFDRRAGLRRADARRRLARHATQVRAARAGCRAPAAKRCRRRRALLPRSLGRGLAQRATSSTGHARISGPARAARDHRYTTAGSATLTLRQPLYRPVAAGRRPPGRGAVPKPRRCSSSRRAGPGRPASPRPISSCCSSDDQIALVQAQTKAHHHPARRRPQGARGRLRHAHRHRRGARRASTSTSHRSWKRASSASCRSAGCSSWSASRSARWRRSTSTCCAAGRRSPARSTTGWHWRSSAAPSCRCCGHVATPPSPRVDKARARHLPTIDAVGADRARPEHRHHPHLLSHHQHQHRPAAERAAVCRRRAGVRRAPGSRRADAQRGAARRALARHLAATAPRVPRRHRGPAARPRARAGGALVASRP